jgi:hypothetical protein
MSSGSRLMSHSPTTERVFDTPVHSFLPPSSRQGLGGHQKAPLFPSHLER